MPLNYSEYLKVQQLLELQVLRSDPPEHDETLFIIIHQVYELWFKQLLHEFDRLKVEFCSNDLYGAIHRLQRARTIMKTLVSQLDILETMTPMSFASFRDRLEEASGFQSIQFREMEFVLGYKRATMLEFVPKDSPARAILERRLKERTVVDCFYDFLTHHGVTIPDELKTGTSPNRPNPTKPFKRASPAFTAKNRNSQSCSSRWSTTTKANRSGATVTSRWSSAPSATSREPVDQWAWRF